MWLSLPILRRRTMRRHIKKPRNPYAAELSDRRYRQRVVKDKRKHLVDKERERDQKEELDDYEV